MVSSLTLLCFRFRQPLLELIKRDDTAVALLFFFSGPLAPCIESLVSEVPGFDPRKTSLVLSAVNFEKIFKILILFCKKLLIL